MRPPREVPRPAFAKPDLAVTTQRRHAATTPVHRVARGTMHRRRAASTFVFLHLPRPDFRYYRGMPPYAPSCSLRRAAPLMAALLFLAAGCANTDQGYGPYPVAPHAPPPGWATPTPPTLAVPRAWIPAAAPRAWQWIVIHHSAGPSGSAAAFHQYHVRHNGWESLGYHFVIGNGNGSADGMVEVGPRWVYQQVGAHAGVRQFNEYGIGICLVGNFESSRPTDAQMRALAYLAGHLMRQYRIPPANIIGHRDCKTTDCPGRNMDLAAVRRMASVYAGMAADQPVASGELMRRIGR